MTDPRDIEIARLRAALVRLMHDADHTHVAEYAEHGYDVGDGEHVSDDELIARAIAHAENSRPCCALADCACAKHAAEQAAAREGATP